MKTLLTLALAAVLSVSLFAGQKTMKHKVSPKQAAQIALKKYPGKLVGTPKVEKEDGIWQYEVLVKSKGKLKEVNVNAETGKITSVENTSAKEEKKEKEDDEKKGG